MKYGLLSTCRALLKPSWVWRGCIEKHTNLIVTLPKMNSRDVHEVESLTRESQYFWRKFWQKPQILNFCEVSQSFLAGRATSHVACRTSAAIWLTNDIFWQSTIARTWRQHFWCDATKCDFLFARKQEIARRIKVFSKPLFDERHQNDKTRIVTFPPWWMRMALCLMAQHHHLLSLQQMREYTFWRVGGSANAGS
jgi:hypothetical protein